MAYNGIDSKIIADTLSKENIYPPSIYANLKKCSNSNLWCSRTIDEMLSNDTSMTGGHYVILNGRNGDEVNVINPIKEKYEKKTLNINFLIKACKDYGAWRIIIMEGKND